MVLSQDESKVLEHLKELTGDWHSLSVICEFIGWDSDRAQDALAELGLKNLIEVDDREDQPWILLKEEVVPLTEDQKILVENNLVLARTVARRWTDKKDQPQLKEELSQQLQYDLIRIVQNYDPDFVGEEVDETLHFRRYAWLTLNKRANRFFQKLNHLRGLNYGEARKGEAVVESLGTPGTNEYWLVEPCMECPTAELCKRDEICHLLSILTPIEQDSILFTEYMGYTQNETCKLIDKSGPTLNRIKNGAVEKLRQAWQYTEDGEVIRIPVEVPTHFQRRSFYKAQGGDVDTVAAIAMGAVSLSNQHHNDLPQTLYDGLENGTYGLEYLQELDERLVGTFLNS